MTCLFSFVYAQKDLDFNTCLKIALQNNLSIKEALINVETAENNYAQSKFEFLPNLNANWSGSRSFGTTFDNIRFIRTTQETNSSNVSASSSLPIFNGFRLQNNVKQLKATLDATQHSVDRTKNDIITNVALNFLQVIFDQENLVIAKNKLVILQQQYERAKKRFDAGIIPENEVLNLSSQVSTEKLNVINQENLLIKDRTTLIQAMNLDPFDEYTILKPDLSVFKTENELPNIDSVYTYALAYMPEMQESMSRITSSTLSFKITQSSLFPTLTLSAGIFTNYTSNGVFDPVTFQVVDVPYFTQLQDNISQSLSLNMSIPIFNRRTTYRNIKNAQLNIKLANVQLENTKNILVKKIQQAYQDAYASKNKFLVTQEQLSSLKLNYNNSKMRYENGILDLLSFNESLNNLTRAETELLQAQYDFIFKYKILDLYQGKEIKF